MNNCPADVQFLKGDCRDIMRTLEPQSVDMVLADPPYGDTSLSWDKHLYGWLQYIPRLLKPHGSLWCFGSLRFFMDRSEDFREWRMAQDIVWEKHNGSSFHADRFKRVHEHIAHFYPRAFQWQDIYRSPVMTMDATKHTMRRKQRPPHMGYIDEKGTAYTSYDGGPRLMRSVLHVRSMHGYATHPTEKPEGVLRPLIEYSCPPGGVVLDPFAGSGSTGSAAMSIGRGAVLIEVDAEYVALIQKRLQSVQRTLPLDAEEPESSGVLPLEEAVGL